MKSAYPDLTVLKIGEPFFQSLSAFASDPRRRADAPVITYSALSSSNRLHWVQMPSKQRSIPAEIAVPCISRLNLHPSQTESCSRRNRCSNRYPILRRYKGLAPLRSWASQHEAAVTASRNSQGSSADMPGFISVFQRSL